LDSALRVNGTLTAPQLADDLTLHDLRYGKLVVPAARGEIVASRTRVTLRNVEADLPRGRVTLNAAVPVRVSRSGGGVGEGPISASLSAQDIDASNLTSVLPKGAHVGGRIDGTVNASGTMQAPHLDGALALTGGAFIGPMEKAPIKNFRGRLVFNGNRVTLQGVHADVGGGSVAAGGWVSIADLSALRGISFALQTRAENAHLELPAYFQGNLNGSVSVARSSNGPIVLGGDVAIASARIPLSAFYNPNAAKGPPPHLPPIAFHQFRVSAGKDVRVQSGEVDVGGAGSMTLGGTLASPTLAGAFRATGGTVSFYRTFTVDRGTISFTSGEGILPYVDAVASTYVADPATAVRLHVTGPVSQMNLDLASDPPYDRAQILGLLTGLNQIGAVRGVSSGNGASGGFSLPGAAQNVALGQVNTMFTRQLLEPLSSSLGGSLGFTDLQITSDLQGGLGLGAAKAFGKNMSVSANETFGTPKVQSVGLEAHPNIATALRMRLYSTSGPSLVGISTSTQPQPVGTDVLNLNPMTAIAYPSGTNGFDFSYLDQFP
jgi:translocation and assembly module TamB